MFVRNTAVTIISCQLDIIHNCEQHAIQNLLVTFFARSSKQGVTILCLAPNLTLFNMP